MLRATLLKLGTIWDEEKRMNKAKGGSSKAEREVSRLMLWGEQASSLLLTSDGLVKHDEVVWMDLS